MYFREKNSIYNINKVIIQHRSSYLIQFHTNNPSSRGIRFLEHGRKVAT